MKKLFCLALLWFSFWATTENEATKFLNKLPQGTDFRITVVRNELTNGDHFEIFYQADHEVK